ncbi:MAG: anaerobic ribonucleoside-triphosphate reductase [Atopococcus tabaci]|uniref:Anaerobic ribonucleoside-triphosphate reductase n=1 Tax=Atopococcus tabaci TaxID=269774 RepID=A0AA43UDG6_9LACT|nr:anaerobic ribonucleoside-triphosphate reductase [Atopococcus tabaci]
MTKVIKKDGRISRFYIEKIESSLESAERVFDVAFTNDKREILNAVEEEVLKHDEIQSSEIFNIVKEALKEEPLILSAFQEFKKVEQKSIDEAVDLEFQFSRFDNKDKNIMNENGNKDSRTAMTQRELLSGVYSKAKGLKMYPEEVQRAHVKGIIHLHDLDRSPYQPLPNCSLPDFAYMLDEGVQLGNARVEKPKSIATAVSILGILISAISGEQYGGVSVHELDKLLAPYGEMTLEKNRQLYFEVLKDAPEVEELARKKTRKDIYDAMQALEYDINTMTTTTAQTPFSTVSYGLGTSWVEREIQKQHLKVRYDGLGKHRITAIFPKILYFVQEGVNLRPGDFNYDIKKLAVKTSASRIYPDMVNIDDLMRMKGGRKPITAMGCRSFLHYWENKDGEEVYEGRNNLGVISINLPHLAIQSKGNAKKFFHMLDDTLELVRKGLHVREDSVLSASLETCPIMYTQGGLGDPTGKTSVRDFYDGDRKKQASISIGYVGVHNAMTALTEDEHWHFQEEYNDLGLDIIRRLDAYAKEINDEFLATPSVYATPSESLADRFASIDRKRFGLIEGVNDKEYYENSFHYPSYLNIDPVKKMSFESQYYEYTPGGFMFYIEQNNLSNNLRGMESLWDAFNHMGNIYAGVNSPNDHCKACGWEGEAAFVKDQGYTCPACKNFNPENMSVVRRLCGYLGHPNKRPVVDGKQEEINSRVKH